MGLAGAFSGLLPSCVCSWFKSSKTFPPLVRKHPRLARYGVLPFLLVLWFRRVQDGVRGFVDEGRPVAALKYGVKHWTHGVLRGPAGEGARTVGVLDGLDYVDERELVGKSRRGCPCEAVAPGVCLICGGGFPLLSGRVLWDGGRVLYLYWCANVWWNT